MTWADRPREGVEMHFDLDPVGRQADGGVALRLPGALNGRRMTFMLDTGASANVISPAFADSLHLKPLADSVLVEGTGMTTGRMVVADSIEIGNLTLHYVPFCVVDITTGRPAYDRYLHHLKAILGRPLLEILGKTTIDFQHRTLTAPGRPKKKQKRTRRSNLSITDNVLMLTVNDSIRLIPDFGATHSSLDSLYFAAHRDDILSTARADTVHYAGFGGIVTAVEYTLTDFPVKIDRKTLVLPSITVNPSSYESRLGMDFFSRQRRIIFDLRRWRLQVH